MKIPDFVVQELNLEGVLAPITKKLKMIMMDKPEPCIRTHNIVFAPVGSESQAWHCDDTITEGKMHRYFTILVHLNPLDSMCGGTEIWVKKLERGDLVRIINKVLTISK